VLIFSGFDRFDFGNVKQGKDFSPLIVLIWDLNLGFNLGISIVVQIFLYISFVFFHVGNLLRKEAEKMS
jgi:hypothetical protein